MTITQLCEKVNVYCAKLNSIVTARGGIYFFILGFSVLRWIKVDAGQTAML